MRPPVATPASAPAARPPPTHLADAVAARALNPAVSFHVPGHKRRPQAPPHPPGPLAAALAAAAAVDTTELAGLDVLAAPTGPIAAAAAAAATAYGVGSCRYLVGGATAGVAAAVMATCGGGSPTTQPRTLLATRAAHQSVVAGAALAGARLAWIAPSLAGEVWGGAAHPPTATAVAAALAGAAAAGHDVGAVLIVSPTYFGAVADVEGERVEEERRLCVCCVCVLSASRHNKKQPSPLPSSPAIAAVCAAASVPLIVDAAHGAHFGLDVAFPPAAAAVGATLSVAGAHKTLAVLTQAALLHVASGVDDSLIAGVDRALALLQSSSPSFLLMASLDVGIAAAAAPGAWTHPLAAAAAVRAAVRAAPGWAALADDERERKKVHSFDPLRVTLAHTHLDGRAAAAALEAAGAVPELATEAVVVLALGAGSAVCDGEALASALATASATATRLPPRLPPPLPPPMWSPYDAPLTPRQALLGAASERVGVRASIGRVAAEALTPYPPGVPVVVPGERITVDAVEAMAAVLAGGGRLVAGDASGESVAVVK